MATAEDNELLTRVGPGTPMGQLLRRYWIPAAMSSEVAEPGGQPLRVRLLGENLIAYRGVDGKPALVDEACPHRGASLYFARNEEGPDGGCGLRCVYHGWQFAADGTCLDMPSVAPGSRFKERVRLPSYPVHESGGLLWAYMGPRETMTPFRNFGTDELAEGEAVVRKTITRCNWVQAMEANLDSSHTSWVHWFHGQEDIPDDGTDEPGYHSTQMLWRFWNHDRRPRLEVQDEWYGFRYTGLRTTPNGHTHSRVTCYVMPWAVLVATNPFGTRMSVHVPIDDYTTFNYAILNQKIVYPERFQGRQALLDPTPFRQVGDLFSSSGVIERDLTAENEYGFDRSMMGGVSFTGVPDFAAQDFMVTESMGPIVDRTKEHLTTSDLAISRMRAQLLSAARGLAAGIEPPALADGEGSRDFRTIRSAEKVLEEGEDWRRLGTDDDPVVQETLGLTAARRTQ